MNFKDYHINVNFLSCFPNSYPYHLCLSDTYHQREEGIFTFSTISKFLEIAVLTVFLQYWLSES